MHSFSIRDIENLSGIKAHTLRIWEVRYGIVKPSRKDSNHRQYGIEELKRILRISHLYNQGFRISKIAQMSDDDISRLTLETQQIAPHEFFINQLIEASIDFDDDLFRQILDSVIYKYGFEHTIVEVVYPFLTKIGMLWLTGNILPAQEHFASHIIRNKIVFETYKESIEKKVSTDHYILFCPPEEYHEIPLLFVQYCLRKRGITSTFLGVNTSVNDLKTLLTKMKATHLFVHFTTNFSDAEPEEMLIDLCSSFPSLEVFAAGRIFEKTTLDQPNLRVFHRLPDFFPLLDRTL